MNLAIIDIGTNTAILLVVRISPDKGFTVLHDEAQICRLGEGIEGQHRFQPEAIKRTVETLGNFDRTIARFQCQEKILIGTAAFRRSNNVPELLKALRGENLNFEIKIISGIEEAGLIHLAQKREFAELSAPLLVLDIGGGSTELILDDGKLVSPHSLPFGVVTLTERFLNTDPPQKDEMQALQNFVRQLLKSSWPLSPFDKTPHLIATAGTPTTLAAIIQNLSHYEPTRVHKSIFLYDELKAVTERLAAIPFAERIKIPCLPPKRADIIIAGACILKTVMEYFGLKKIQVSDRSLRYGVLYDFISNWPS